MRARRKLGITLLVALSLAVAGGFAVGFSCVRFDAAEAPVAIEDTLDEALDVALVESLVDYERLAAFRSSQGVGIEALAAALAPQGPQSTPDRYATRAARLAYYLNAYNILVLASVVRFAPIESVHDVRGLIEPAEGFGFFYGLTFEVDGSWTNLYDLENERIRGFGDARIHAAINCASASCPALSPRAFRAAQLESQLDAAAQRFVSDERHVRYDEAENTLHLSSIFEWFRDDFDAHTDASGGSGVRAFIDQFCQAETCPVSGDPQTEFMPYDWSLNAR